MQFKQSKLPEERVLVKREGDQLVVYEIRVVKLGALDEVRLPGRRVYQAPDGKVFTRAQDAAEYIAGVTRDSDAG